MLPALLLLPLFAAPSDAARPAADAHDSARAAPGASSPSAPGANAPNAHIVVFKPETPPEERRRLVEAAGAELVRELPFIDALLVKLPRFSPNGVQPLRSSPAVESVEENVYRRWIESAALSPAFPRPSDALGGLEELSARIEAADPEKERPWGVRRVKASALWPRSRGRGVRVAVIDTGIDGSHPDLAPNYKGGFNAVDPEASPFDDNGHGTHVAGTIAAASGNGGVAGVAPEASLYAVKVLDGDGGGTPAGIVEGIRWAAENGMQVVNMSLGGPSSAAMRRAVRAAYERGITVVAASGNDPEEPVGAPARYPESLAVSASTEEDSLAFFSTVGPEIDFIAPGHEVWSAAPGGKFAKHSGTSMASPHVAGLAALAVALGAKGPAQVRAALEKAARPLPGLSPEQQGAGLAEADRWLE